MWWLLVSLAMAAPLEDRPGRAESRILSAPYALVHGRSPEDMRLVERLDRLQYRRVDSKPTEQGTWFYGTSRVWIFRRAYDLGGSRVSEALIGLARLEDGQWSVVDGRGRSLRMGMPASSLEPEVLAESLDHARAARIPVTFAELPEHTWRPLLALEDHRFFEHIGVDGIAIARALLANARAGQVSEGGSTITQQLIKNRALSPRRTLDRKASEAVRALALEAEYDKQDILQAYLNTVYYGQVDGIGIYGMGAAARAYFSKPASALTLEESASLAAMVQGPNSMNPLRSPERNKRRRDRALQRMEELGWATPAEVRHASSLPVRTNPSPVRAEMSASLRSAIRSQVAAYASERLSQKLGVVVHTTLDGLAQHDAESALARGLRSAGGAQGAAVVLDASNGHVHALVGGHGRGAGSMNRAYRAQRQPGSTVKPFVLGEALERCGQRQALHLATRVSDEPLSLEDRSATWSPNNADGRNHGPTRLREALVFSYNRPFARVGQACGTEAIAERMARAGLETGDPAPASIVLGTIENTPLALAGAYGAMDDGLAHSPTLVTRIDRPMGGTIWKHSTSRGQRVFQQGTAFLLRDVMADAVRRGTATRAAVPGVSNHGKTGSTRSDAWFAGLYDRTVVVVWTGHDDARPLGLSGGRVAAPIASELGRMALSYQPLASGVPASITRREIDPRTGLRVGVLGEGQPEWFRRQVMPPTRPLLGGGESEVLR